MDLCIVAGQLKLNTNNDVWFRLYKELFEYTASSEVLKGLLTFYIIHCELK